MPKCFQALKIEISDPALTFNFFDYENDQWYANFYEPELRVAIQDIFKDNKEEYLWVLH